MKKQNIIIGVVVIVILVALYFLLGRPSSVEAPVENNHNDNNQVMAPPETIEEAISRLSEVGATLTKEMVVAGLPGAWSSLDRPGYEVEFKSTGEVMETLGESRTDGTWEVTGPEEVPGYNFGTESFKREGVYLKQALDEGKSFFFYKVVQIDGDRLVVIYLNSGGILGFDRIR